MKIDWVILATAAEVRDDLVHILGGGWNYASYPAFPAQVHGAIAALLVIEPAELATAHEMRIEIRDSAEQSLADVRFPVPMPRPAPPGLMIPQDWAIHVPIAVNLSGVVIPGPGQYRVVVAVDGLYLHEPLPMVCVLQEPGA